MHGGFSMAALKKALKLCLQFMKPGKNATFVFSLERVWLHAVSFDDCIQCAIEFDKQFFGYYGFFRTSSISTPSSYTVILDDFAALVNFLADFHSIDSVDIIGHVGSFDLSVNFVADFHSVEEPKAFTVTADRMEVYINPQNFVKLAISARIFKTMIEYFDNFDADKVTITVMPEEATFAINHHQCILSKARYEYILHGNPSEFPLVAELSFEHLRSAPLKRAIRMVSTFIWLCPSGPDGAPPALMCPVPSIGKITFCFL